MTPYEKLIANFKERLLVDTATEMLYWDMETYISFN